jgi:hypothetical protein
MRTYNTIILIGCFVVSSIELLKNGYTNRCIFWMLGAILTGIMLLLIENRNYKNKKDEDKDNLR